MREGRNERRSGGRVAAMLRVSAALTSSSSTVSSITVACPILCRAVWILLPSSANTMSSDPQREGAE